MLHNRSHHGVAIAAVLVALLASAASAAAAAPRRIGPSVRPWSVSKITQGLGKELIGRDTQRKGFLDKVFDVGHAAFNIGGSPLRPDAAASVGTTPDGGQAGVEAQAPSLDPFQPRAAKGSVAHLDEYQAYEMPKDRRGASLMIRVGLVSLEMVDANGPLSPEECQAAKRCSAIRTIVRFRARAYPIAGGHPFFDSGGAVYAEGHEHAWEVGAATLPDSRRPFWPDAQFEVHLDRDNNGSGSHLLVRTAAPPGEPQKATVMNVPLRSLDPNELFMVHVTMDAEAIDDRGRESAA